MAVTRRHLLFALFIYGVIFMTYQLLSLWAAGNGKMTKATHGEGQSPIQNEVRDVKGTKLHVLGVAPQDMKHYIADKKFKCLSDHAVIDFSQVNDDYCDCSDGSDEPGTAACSSGRYADRMVFPYV